MNSPRSKSKTILIAQNQFQIDRSFIIKEIKSLNIEDGNFRRILKPLSEEELGEIQLDYGELMIRREKNEKEGKRLKEKAMTKKKKNKKEKRIKLSDLRPPSPASTST